MLHRRDATQKYYATLARGTAPSYGRKKVDVRSFFAFHGVFLRVSSVRTNRAEICTRTSVQVAIGLFPIDSVRAEFLLLSLLFFAHCLHLPFTCTSCSFFFALHLCCRLPLACSLAFSFLSLPFTRLHRAPHLPFFFCFFFVRRLFVISTRTRLRKPCINDRIGGAFGDLDPPADTSISN